METKSKKIREMPAADRTREQLTQYGNECLSNAGLIAIIRGAGNKATLLDIIGGNLANLETLHIQPIAKVKDTGEIKTGTLLGAMALRKSILRQAAPLTPKDDPTAGRLTGACLTVQETTQSHLMLMNNRHELLATSRFETEKRTLLGLKAIFRLSLEACTAAIVRCRNDTQLPVRFCDLEKFLIIPLDAAANMLQFKMRGVPVSADKADPGEGC